MGIRGLTTFVKNRSRLCMEKYELHDTNLVLDGDAVLCKLYLWHCGQRNGCFGGDYDKFGDTIIKFFDLLSACNVVPYVVFDGGYESRKMDTIKDRFRNRLKIAEELNSETQTTSLATPLFIREAFEDIVIKKNIRVVRCDFEGDRETASIANILNCPVMSFDSDFFIFDAPYIPFSSFKMYVIDCFRTDKNTGYRRPVKYIPCELYKVDYFLKCIGGLEKDKLPILAALLGNDFINGIDFSKLFHPHYTDQSNWQKQIEYLIEWLKKETVETAIEKVLGICESSKRKLIANQIKNTIRGYTCINSKFFKYLVTEQENVRLKHNIDLYEESYNASCEDDEYNVYEKLIANIPEIFMERFRKSLYPTRFLDIIVQNKYYNFKPQVENDNLENCHNVSIDIIKVIHKILTNSSENLICLTRIGKEIDEQVLPLCDIDVPLFLDIQKMTSKMRIQTFLKILHIDQDFVLNCLNSYPTSWQLFIISIKYLYNKSEITWSLINALLLCKLILECIDTRVGFYRRMDVFMAKYGSKITGLLCNRRTFHPVKNTLMNALEYITFNDSLLALHKLIPLFEMDRKMRTNKKLFDRNLVHSMSQFQSCLLHVKFLNELFNLPFENCLISESFNGTFVYNLTDYLRNSVNIDHCIEDLLKNSPSVLYSFKLLVRTFKESTRDYPVLNKSLKT